MAYIRLSNGKVLKDVEPLFSYIEKEYPHETYSQFCKQFGIGFNNAQSILSQNQGTYGKAVREVLNKWLNKGDDVTQDKLESAFKESSFGGHIKNLRTYWTKAVKDEFSEEDESSTDTSIAVSQPNQRRVEKSPKSQKRVKEEPNDSEPGSSGKRPKIEKPFCIKTIVVEKIEVRQKKGGRPFHRMAVLIPGKKKIEELLMFEPSPSPKLRDQAFKLETKDRVVFTHVKRYKPRTLQVTNQTIAMKEKDLKVSENDLKIVERYINLQRVTTMKQATELPSGRRMSVKGEIIEIRDSDSEDSYRRKNITLVDKRQEQKLKVTLWNKAADIELSLNDEVIITAVIKKDNVGYESDYNSTPSTVVKPLHEKVQTGKVVTVQTDPEKRKGSKNRYPLIVIVESGSTSGSYHMSRKEDKINILNCKNRDISFVRGLNGTMTNVRLREPDAAKAESSPSQSGSEASASGVADM